MQQPAMSERSQNLTEQWLFKVADLDGRTRFISNSLLGGAPDMEEPMQSTRTKKLVNASLVDDEVDRPRRFAAGNHSNKPWEGDTIFSGSRSWRSCNEEVIKKVIRESLLLNSSDGDKAASSRSLGSYLRGGFNLPNYEGEMKRKNSVTALDQPVKMNPPSLIARLMGLESVPAGAAGPTAKPKPSRDQNPNAARLMLHFQKPERVTLRNIIEREKIERLMRASEQDCRLGFSVTLGKEHAPSVSEAMQKPSWGRGEEKEDFNPCKCSAQQPAEFAKLEHGEIITLSDRRKPEHESERKEVRILRKTKLEPSKNSKTPASARHGQLQNEAAKAFKKFDGSRRAGGFSRDHLQSRKDVKTSAASLSPSKTNATASAEPQSRADTAKRNLFKKIGRKLAFRNSTTPGVEKKDTGVKSAQKMTKSKTTKQKDGEEISPSCKPEDAPVINTSPAAEPRQQEQLSSKTSINEQTKKDQKMIRDIMPKADKAAAAAVKLVDDDLIDTKIADKVEYLESLLLGCQSFLLALGDADACTHHETRDTNKIDKDVKPYLCCAEELILRKRHHQQLLSHPLLMKCCSWRSAEHALPLDQLVGEISRGIRRLASYSEVDHEVSSRDSLYMRLERDLECKDMVLDAMWDVDWRNAICVEEADHVAGQLEDHVLSALVEEFAMELANCCCNKKGFGFSEHNAKKM